MKILIPLFIIAFFLLSCINSKEKKAMELIQKWNGKTILFPSTPIFTIQGKDTLDYQISDTYKILTYADSTGCTSCKLNLSEWREFIVMVDSIKTGAVQFLFFLYPKSEMNIYHTLRMENFNYPICIDVKDSLNILNHFPTEMAFQTFLIDSNNKVLAIGNPIRNPRIKQLYLDIILGKRKSDSHNEQILTTAELSLSSINMKDFSYEDEQESEVQLINTGKELLKIDDVVTSCGCMKVEYDKRPVRPGGNIMLKVKYKADKSGYFNKIITIYCNTENAPLQVQVKGTAM